MKVSTFWDQIKMQAATLRHDFLALYHQHVDNTEKKNLIISIDFHFVLAGFAWSFMSMIAPLALKTMNLEEELQELVYFDSTTKRTY